VTGGLSERKGWAKIAFDPTPRVWRSRQQVVRLKAKFMSDEPADSARVPCEPDIDENGVDLAQIRQMLDLTPAERLSRIAEFMSSLLAIRALNGRHEPG